MSHADGLMAAAACALVAQATVSGVLIALILGDRRGRDGQDEEAAFWFRQADGMLESRRAALARAAELEVALETLIDAAEAYAAVSDAETDEGEAARTHAALADALDEAEEVLG